MMQDDKMCKAGVCCGPCNPSKWEAEFWGWLEVWRPALLCSTVNQHPHWACWQYGHSGGTQGWLGVGERAIWAVGYIQQLKALLGSSNGWAQCRFPDQNRQTKVLCWWDDNASLGVRNNSDRGFWSLLWYCNRYLLCWNKQTNKMCTESSSM